MSKGGWVQCSTFYGQRKLSFWLSQSSWRLSGAVVVAVVKKSEPMSWLSYMHIIFLWAAKILKGSWVFGWVFSEASSFGSQLVLESSQRVLGKISCTCFQTWQPFAPASDNPQKNPPHFPLCIFLSGLSLRRASFWSLDSQSWDLWDLAHRNIFLHRMTWSGNP